jgi:hypothetical protein
MTSKTPLLLPFVCRKSVPLIPDLTPFISNLSMVSSTEGVYTVVTIYGNNFSLYGITGISVVNFTSDNSAVSDNGLGKDKISFTNLPVSFYSSQQISFSVPLNASSGNYFISVVNKQYPISLTSNSVSYTVNSSKIELTPTITNLSIYSSIEGIYTEVIIYGYLFSFDDVLGTSVVNFVSSNTSYTHLPVTFYSSEEISFVVPIHAPPGNYSITVANIKNLTSRVSNSVSYTIYPDVP